MKELTLERSTLHVSNVEKPLVPLVTSKNMREITLEQNVTYVNNVENPSVGPVTLECI
jgi:hypothetical protein